MSSSRSRSVLLLNVLVVLTLLLSSTHLAVASPSAATPAAKVGSARSSNGASPLRSAAPETDLAFSALLPSADTTLTPTPTITPMLAVTPTVTLTPTVTPTSTPALTLTVTPTPTPTVAPVLTPTLTPAPAPVLSLSKSVTPTTAVPGEVVTFTLALTNTGATPAKELVLYDPLPKGLEYVAGSAPGAKYDPDERLLTWELPELGINQALALPLAAEVTAASGEKLANVAAMSSADAAEPVNATATVEVGWATMPDQVLITPEEGGTLVPADGWVQVQVPPGTVAQRAWLKYEPVPGTGPEFSQTFRLALVTEESALSLSSLSKPLTLTVALRVPAQAAKTLQLVRLDEGKGAWEALASEVVASEVVSSPLAAVASTTQLGDFGLLSTLTGGGDGTAYLLGPSILGLQADLFTGNGSFHYPIPVPASPGDLSLPLGLSYSSEEANSMYTNNGEGEHYTQASWAGLGWNLNGLGRIYRSGIDAYLSFGGGSYKLVSQGDNQWSTEPHSFLRIWHAGGTTGSEHWDVWTPDGTHYLFGNPDDVWGGGTAYSNWTTCDMNGERGYAWYLTRIYDTHENWIKVNYAHEYGRYVGCGDPYRNYIRATRPTNIYFFPAAEQEPTVQVAFSTETRDDWKLSLDTAADWPWDKATCADTMNTKRYYMFSCYRLSQVDVQARQPSGWFSVGSYDLNHVTIGEVVRKRHIVLRSIHARGASATPGIVGTLAPTQHTFYHSHESTLSINRSHLLSAQNGYGGQVSLAWEEFEKGDLWSCDGPRQKRYRVTRREASAGTGPDMVTTYDYNDSELTGCDLPDTTERFWGHGLVTADALRSDSSVARREQTIFWQTEKVVRGKSTQSMVLAPDDGGGLRLAAQTIREWWGYEGWPRLGAQIEYNCGGGVCQNKRTEYIHDPLMQGGTQYGNLTGIMEYDEDGVLYRQTRRYYNVSDEPGASPPDTTAYMVDRVQQEYVWGADSSDFNDLSSLTWYYYDGNDLMTDPLGDHGDLTWVQRLQFDGISEGYRWFDSSDVTYAYDSYGNRVTETAYRGPGRVRNLDDYPWTVSWVSYPTDPLTTTTSYDGYYHVFPLTVTGPLGHVTSSQYYGVNGQSLDHGSGGFFGQVKSTTDANGLTTSHKYDTFGRLTQQKAPDDPGWGMDNVSLYQEYASFGTLGQQRIVTRRGRNAQWQESFFDGLGRTIQVHRQKDGSGLVEIRTTTAYNELGQVEKEWVPYEGTHGEAGPYGAWGYVPASDTLPHTAYQYDGLGRATRATQPDGTTTQTSHGSWTSITSDANAHAKLYRNDAFGRLKIVDENQDAVTFQDDFSTMNGDAWEFNSHQVLDEISDGNYAIKNSGTGSNWDANFYRSAYTIDGGEEGQGIQVEFKVDGGDTGAHVSLEAPGYYRLGIVASDNTISAQYNVGSGYVHPANLIDPIVVGAWYVARLKVTPEGSAYIEVWRKDDPGQRGVHALQMPSGVAYRFRHWVYSGNAWLDNYREFDALVTSYGYDRLDNLTVVTDTLGITTTMQYDMFGRKEAMHDPDMGDWSYSYDALGNLLTQTDAKSQVIGFAYDGLNRLVEKDYGDDGTPEARYYYDGDTCTGCATPTGEMEGQQTAAWTAGSWTVYHYDDARGRLSSEERSIDGAPGGPFETGYTYDAMDRPVTMTMPDTEVITTTYNVRGLPVALAGDSPYVTGTSYNVLGQVIQLDLGNNTSTTYSYYSAEAGNNRLQQIQVEDGSLLDLVYSYDDVGNVVQIVDGQVQTQTFSYDALDRLTGASAQAGGPWAAYSGSYEYDRVGNLRLKAEGGITHTMRYSDTAHVHAVSAVDGVAQSYDANGNMTLRVIDGVTYTQGWDQENRLVWVSTGGVTTTFTYDASGALVKKEDPAVGTTYYVGPHYEVLVPAVILPPAPADLTACYESMGGPNVCNHLAWSGSSGVTYNVYRSSTSPVPIDAGHRIASGLTETAYTDCGRYKNYYYAVTAVNENGESDPSNEAQASEPCGSAMAMTLPVLNATALTESGGDPVVTKYYFAGGKRVALDRDGVVQWLVGDHLGTTSLVLDDQGSKVAESRHYPYGEERWRWPQEGTFPTDYRFTGQRSESGLGLYFMGARQYDSALGRWISADAIVPNPTTPQSFNRYAYVRNSPLNYVDPTGHMEDGECGPDGAGCVTSPEDAPLPPEIEELIQVFSYFYGVPWEVVAGLLLSEIKLDTQPKDYFETAFMHIMPKLAGQGGAGASFLLTFALLLKPDPGPGIGNVHVSTARQVSAYFAIHYADNLLMQLNLHGPSTAEVGYQLTDSSVNIQVVAAYTRLLSDYRFGSGGYPSMSNHADMAEWTSTDAVAVWHGYRYGLTDVSPGGVGFTISTFQNRGLDLATTVDLAGGGGKKASMEISRKYFKYYMRR